MTSRIFSTASRPRYPLATVAAYGPDNRRATKLVAAIVGRAGQEPREMRSWTGGAGDVRNDRVIADELTEWLRSRAVKQTVHSDRIIGCPHEEGVDYPEGQPCPQCPFWAGRDRWAGPAE